MPLDPLLLTTEKPPPASAYDTAPGKKNRRRDGPYRTYTEPSINEDCIVATVWIILGLCATAVSIVVTQFGKQPGRYPMVQPTEEERRRLPDMAPQEQTGPDHGDDVADDKVVDVTSSDKRSEHPHRLVQKPERRAPSSELESPLDLQPEPEPNSREDRELNYQPVVTSKATSGQSQTLDSTKRKPFVG
ncbi:hypothetical protein ISCGN_023641 [Ixodes scapularis]